MKYEFKIIGLDNFELHYKKNDEEKIIPFKRTVEMAKKLQSVEATARFNMMEYLNSIGKTKNDLIITKKKNGKTIIDETNYREFESKFIEEESLKIVNEIYELTLGMNLVEIVNELNFENQQEVFGFSQEMRKLLLNEKKDFPSDKKSKVE